MMSRPREIHARRSALVLSALGGLLTVCVIAGCSSPRARYEVLSFFFDGVPDPDEAARRAAEAGEGDGSAREQAKGDSTHGPVVDGRCNECHGFERPASGRGLIGPVSRDAIDRAWFACTRCHGMMSSEPDAAIIQRTDLWLHGPVAVGECRACHVGHRSPYPSLLRSPRVEKDCLSCHAELGERSGAMASLDCTTCHAPHSAERASDLLLRGGHAGNCAQCHPRNDGEPPWLHGPVAKGNCSACHDAHGGASSPRHVRRPLKNACTSCHASEDVPAPCRAMPEDRTSERECDECHDPHAAESAAQLFLRDRAGADAARRFRPASVGD